MAKKVTERVIEIDARGAENSIRALRSEIKQLTEAQRDLDIESAEFRDISAELTAAQTKLRNAVQGNTAAVEGSYKAYSHQLQTLKEHRKWLAEGTEEYRKATEEITKLDAKLKEMDAEIGVYGRNVGNYASAFEGLNGGVQQAAQNIPQLVNGSQNLFDVVKSSVPTIIKSAESIGEVATQGSKAKAVMGALAKSIFSWQTMLVAGIAILAEYGGKIVGWVKGLFSAEKATKQVNEAQEEFNKGISEGITAIGEDIYLINKLSQEWSALGESLEEKRRFIADNAEALNGLGVEVKDVKDAEKLFIEQTPKYIEALKARAKADAARKYAEQKYTEAIEAEMAIELYKAQNPEPDLYTSATSQAEMDKRYYAFEKWYKPLAPLYDKLHEAEEWADKAFELAEELGAQSDQLFDELGITNNDKTVQMGGISTKVTVDRNNLSIPSLGGNVIDQSSAIEANKARLDAYKKMEIASVDERKAIEEQLTEDLAFIEQMRLETHEMLLKELLRSDELNADERIAIEEELSENLAAQAELRAGAAEREAERSAKAAKEQGDAEKKAAEEVMAIEKKKQEMKQQLMQQSSAILRNLSSTLEENTAEYKAIQSAAVVIDTITAAMAGYKQGMAYGGPAAPVLAALYMTTAITAGAAQLHALMQVEPDGSNASGALSSAQVPNIASSMPAAYTRNLMGDSELSELNKDTRVYVVESDITEAQNASRVRVESASF